MIRALFALLLILLPLPALAKPAEIVKSPGGIVAWLVEDHANPMLAMSFAFRAGAATDPADKVGLATFVSGMLDEGAGEMDSRAFQDRLDALSIEMSFSAGLDRFDGQLKTLGANRAEAFGMLGDALTKPRFDAEPLERMRAVFLAKLRQRQENPNARASDALFSAAFPGHPYGRPAAGTEAGLTAIGAADLKEFVTTRFTRDNLIVGVVGDVTAAQLGPLLDRAFGGLAATSPVPPVPDATPRFNGKAIVVDMPVPQASAVFAQKGPARSDPDWLPFQIAMYTLGDGGFSSRLTEEVRVKRGLAYSVGAESAPLLHAPLVVGGVGTQTAKIGESLAIIRAEWAKMRDHGPTDDEIAAAKSYLAGSLPLTLNSSGAIARTLIALQYYHLPPDELDRRADVLAAIPAETIRAAARRWLTPDALTFAVTGEAAKMNLTAATPKN